MVVSGLSTRGDAIALVRDREGLNYLDGCARLGIDPGERQERPSPPLPQTEPPSPLWQRRGHIFIELSHACLQSPAGRDALRYLRQHRGLTMDTIARWRLGYNSTDGRSDNEQWGMRTQSGRVWLPAGIVIPGEPPGALRERAAVKRGTGRHCHPDRGRV